MEVDKIIQSLEQKHPGELGFILQCKNYDEYVATYTDIGGQAEEAAYTDHEFKVLKDYFGDED